MGIMTIAGSAHRNEEVGRMVRGVYLVNRRRTDVDKEVALMRSMMGVDIEPMFFEDIVTTVGDMDEGTILLTNGERVPLPDFVSVRAFGLDAGENYRMKAVLRMLEDRGVLCVNPSACKDITSDKLLTFQVASRVIPDVRMPKTLLVTPGMSAETVAREIGYPVVLKVLHGEGGAGITLAQTEGELRSVLKLFNSVPFGDQLIAQEAIMSSKGRDLRLIVIGDRVVDSLVRVNPGSFTSNVHQGGHVEEFDPPEHLKDAAVRLAEVIGMRMGSVDFLFGEKEDEFYLCEANSSIGLPYLVDGGRGDVGERYLEGMRRLLELVR